MRGIATAWMVVDPVLNSPVYYRVFVKLHLSMLQYLETLRPAITASAFMAVSVLGIQRVLVPSWPLAVRFALQVLGGAAGVLGLLVIFHRQRLLAFVGRFGIPERRATPNLRPCPPGESRVAESGKPFIFQLSEQTTTARNHGA